MKPASRRKSMRQPRSAKAKAASKTKAIQGKKEMPPSHGEQIQHVRISKIDLGHRHRKDYGDLEELAADILQTGLLQPIGLTKDNKLVFGGRRLRACGDILQWETIPARIVNVSSIVAGEYSENELRKDFTPSERVAIAKALQQEIGERRGNPSIRLQRDELYGRTDDVVAKKAGFSDRSAYRRAKKVVEKGSPKLIDAMDSEKVSITAAARVANLSAERQNELLDLDARKLRQAAAKLQPNGHAIAASKKQHDPIHGTNDWIRATAADLKNHWQTVETILVPICDEQRNVMLKLIEKRVLVSKLQEVKELHRNLERVLSAYEYPNR